MHDIFVCFAFFAIVFTPCVLASRSDRKAASEEV
jgi:hypothetical protein